MKKLAFLATISLLFVGCQADVKKEMQDVNKAKQDAAVNIEDAKDEAAKEVREGDATPEEAKEEVKDTVVDEAENIEEEKKDVQDAIKEKHDEKAPE